MIALVRRRAACRCFVAWIFAFALFAVGLLDLATRCKFAAVSSIPSAVFFVILVVANMIALVRRRAACRCFVAWIFAFALFAVGLLDLATFHSRCAAVSSIPSAV